MADNVEIQGLEFQIVNDSTQAVAGLQNLINTLNRLKTACSGSATSLNTTAQAIRGLSNALKGLNAGDTAQKITRIATAMQSLKNLSGVKISSSLANQITAIGTAVKSIQFTDGDKLTTLANGLRPLSELGKANMTTFINQLSKLPKVIEDLEAADIDKFTRQMKDLAAAMKPFADEMQKVSNGFSAFPSKIQKVITSSEKYNSTVSGATARTNTFGTALRGLRFVSLTVIFRKVSQFLGSAINRASEYLEDMNLFTVSMGEYAEEAYKYAQQVSEVMGIDPAEWMRNQGVFNTIITGFGVVSDKAALMSKNLTQLGYDISSFYNIPFAESMQKVQSGIAGELEPLRRIGYDLSVARLQQEAYNLGISKSVSAMTQAEKAQLRYYTMMTQVTQVQGDMARTLEQPTNMIRVLKAQLEQAARAIGDLFIPALTKILPIAIAVAKALREIIAAVAALFGVELQTPDWSNAFDGASVGSGEIADNMDDAAGAAKKLKQYIAGFDELNVFSPSDSSGSSSGIGLGGDLGIDLPEYDFLKGAVTDQIDKWQEKLKPFIDWIKEHLEDILTTVTTIGAGLLAWRFAKGFLQALQILKNLRPKNLKFSIDFPVLGLSMFLADMKEFERYLRDFMDNGATFQNVAGMISEFAGMIGDAFIILGNVKLGAALKVVQGIGEVVVAIKDIADNGVNWDNALTAVRGLTNIAIGIELLTGNIKAAGWLVAIQGFTTIIRELATNWEAIKQGDWSGVDKVTLIVGALEILGGLVVALDAFSKLKGLATVGESVTAVQTVTEVTGGLETATGNLSPKLSGLAKNLGMSIVIIAEVSAAAIIVAGAIWVLGEELGKVGEAWQPVIENAGTVAIAIGVGAGLIAAVGLATYGLGTLGGTAALNIGIGTAILLELGIAAGLFLIEIWAIGTGLDQVGQAWEPVIASAPIIETAIITGTTLLVAVGVATAALGMATVASAGLLPVAIGLGTAILVELAAAFVLFTESLVVVADEINDSLSPALSRLNPKLPKLKSDMEDFTEYMTDLADEVSSYSKSMGSITWSSIVGSFQKLFAGNPIGTLADDVNTIYNDTVNLNAKLNLANPELTLAVQLLTSYVALMSQLQLLTQQGNDASTLSLDMFTNLQLVGENLVTGLVQGIDNKLAEIQSKIAQLKTVVTTGFKDMMTLTNTNWNIDLTTMGTRFNTFTTESMSALNSFSQSFQTGWKEMWRAVGNTSIAQMNSIIKAIANGMNEVIDQINEVIDQLNKMTMLGLFDLYLPKIRRLSVKSISMMADGGFVDEGQLFIAREAGAEMVGAMGRKTAVANNDQIVEGISAGVSIANDGVIAAIYALLNAVEEKDFSVNIGDNQIGESYDRYNRVRGVRVNTGAFSNAY